MNLKVFVNGTDTLSENWVAKIENKLKKFPRIQNSRIKRNEQKRHGSNIQILRLQKCIT